MRHGEPGEIRQKRAGRAGEVPAVGGSPDLDDRDVTCAAAEIEDDTERRPSVRERNRTRLGGEEVDQGRGRLVEEVIVGERKAGESRGDEGIASLIDLERGGDGDGDESKRLRDASPESALFWASWAMNWRTRPPIFDAWLRSSGAR